MGWREMLGTVTVAGIVIAVPMPPDQVSHPIGEVALPAWITTPGFD